MESDPAKKQYFIFGAIIAFIFSFFLNFTIFGSMDGPFVGGFPINVSDSEGFSKFLYQIINTVVMGGLLSVPAYYVLMWLQTRRGGF